MSTFSTDWWIRFFTDAGIPSFASSKYAAIFHENRIQSNMLMDLEKDILKEMGITVIGDIIAILKHAKDVYREVIFMGFYDIYTSIGGENSTTKRNQSEINEIASAAPIKKKNVANKVKKVITKRVKVSSESEEEEIPLKLVKKKIPSQTLQNTVKVVTRKLVSKPKPSVKVKPIVLESDDDSPPLTELKPKSSVFDRLGVGDVSSTTPNFDNNNSPITETRKSSVFKRLGVKQTGEPNANATFKRAIKGGNNTYYGPNIPSEETSAFTKRIKHEETNSNSSKSVFERIGATCDREKMSPGLVSKSALLRNAGSGGRPIYVNPKVNMY
ncbi:Hypothetical protein CINCED_3A000933 [Cinara cedri]|uniref:SAM domain-containing protein n=1 Tax=Cinara cedri TaxID=506608 RepID=A0A5E4MCQ6_9HEMI|nr:Hypothetical protein CINCED_3A000933 [Cinara cedri]